MIWRAIFVATCPICGRDVARVFSAPKGFAVMCDPESGGCGAESVGASSEALAIENWNQCPSPAARAVAQAAWDRSARRALLESGVQYA